MLFFAIGALGLALFPEADVASLVLSFAFLDPTSFDQIVLVRFATFFQIQFQIPLFVLQPDVSLKMFPKRFLYPGWLSV